MNLENLMMLILSLIIAVPAGTRLAGLIQYEDGPFDILLELRQLLGVKETWEDDEKLGFFHHLLSCVRCTSVWCGLALTPCIMFPEVGFYLMLPFAISEGIIRLNNDQ